MNKSESIWRPVEGYEGIYEVSSAGEVKSLPRLKYCGHKGSPPQKVLGRTLKISEDRLGYSRVKLSKDGTSNLKYLHRIIASAFIEPIAGKTEVNHIDGDKSNNALKNLEWVNRSENMKHNFSIGISQARRGDDNNKAKLSWDSVKKIRKLYSDGVSQKDLSEKFEVTIANISCIVNHKTWKEIS